MTGGVRRITGGVRHMAGGACRITGGVRHMASGVRHMADEVSGGRSRTRHAGWCVRYDVEAPTQRCPINQQGNPVLLATGGLTEGRYGSVASAWQ